MSNIPKKLRKLSNEYGKTYKEIARRLSNNDQDTKRILYHIPTWRKGFALEKLERKTRRKLLIMYRREQIVKYINIIVSKIVNSRYIVNIGKIIVIKNIAKHTSKFYRRVRKIPDQRKLPIPE